MGESIRSARNQHLLIAREPKSVAEREGGRAPPRTSHRPRTCGLISRRAFHTIARHTACNNSFENSAPSTSCASQNRQQTAPCPPGGSFHWSCCENFGSQSPLGRPHFCTNTTWPRQWHLSKEKLAPSSQFAIKLLNTTGCRLCSTPFPLDSDSTRRRIGEGRTVNANMGARPMA